MKFKSIIAFLISLLTTIVVSQPALTHWADLSVAEIFIESEQIEINLTFPTAMTGFADTDRDGKISTSEFNQHQSELTQFIGSQIQIKEGKNNIGTFQLSYSPDHSNNNQLSAPNSTHSTFNLLYTFPDKVNNPSISYEFFLPNVPTATCLATILSEGKGEQFIFSPTQTTYSVVDGTPNFLQQNLWLAVAGAFVWGGMHALSPGHGKTLVAAYLVGERATWHHALILGITTTTTHTIGVIIMGGIALFATQFFTPESIFPWLSLVAGLGILVVGLHLLWNRLFNLKKFDHHHGHHHHDHSHIHDHKHHHHDHSHNHDHEHHHSLPQTDRDIPWQRLIALGIASGLTPCPAALVLLLGAVSLKQISLGISLVICFSIGLAIVLSGLGIILVSAKDWLQNLPISPKNHVFFPIVSAIIISLLGLVSTINSIRQILIN